MKEPDGIKWTVEQFECYISYCYEKSVYLSPKFIVRMWYCQCEYDEPEIFNILYEWDQNYADYVWDWDWDEGGTAYILGFIDFDKIDIEGRFTL